MTEAYLPAFDDCAHCHGDPSMCGTPESPCFGLVREGPRVVDTVSVEERATAHALHTTASTTVTARDHMVVTHANVTVTVPPSRSVTRVEMLKPGTVVVLPYEPDPISDSIWPALMKRDLRKRLRRWFR